MALTGRIVANIYGKNGNALENKSGTPNGRVNYFANNMGSTFYSVGPDGKSFNGVVCNSIIEVFPTGLKVNSDLYYAVETVAQLVTNGI
jgi:hypothetical protein